MMSWRGAVEHALTKSGVTSQPNAPGYTFRLSESIDETNLDDWNSLRDGDRDVFMAPGFIAAVEQSMGREVKCWTLVVYDEQHRPAATACLSLMPTDGAMLMQGFLRRGTQAIRRVWKRYLYFKVLFQGLPVSAGQSHLRIRPDANIEQVLATIETVLDRLARQHGAWLIVLKEFTPSESNVLDGLQRHGYLRVESVPMNCLAVHYRDFDDFCRSRSGRARHNLRRSVRKFDEAGLRVLQISGGEGADKLYNDEVHCLYEAVWDRAPSRLEKLPAEFFRQLARNLGDQAVFSFAYLRDRIVGFGCSLRASPNFHMLFVGLDYDVNRRSELYFNLCYKELDFAMRHGTHTIFMGQTADVFKSRLRCCQRRLYFFVKLRGRFGFILRWVADLFFPRPLEPAAETSRAARGTLVGVPAEIGTS
jgi:predicted N-acyltransferase